MNNQQEIIFMDASIFIEQNFIYGHKIKTIFEQAEKGEIKIILPRLIYDEILNHISIKIKEEVKITQKLALLKNIYEDKIEEASIIVEKFQNIFKETIKKAKVEIIEYPKDVAIIEEIFTNYFQVKPPFGGKKKKCEFPDAFALKILENWAKEQKKNISIFSNDKDIKNFKSEDLKVYDFKSFVKNLIEKEKMNNKLNAYIGSNRKNIEKKIEDWVRNQLLDDDSKYYDLDIIKEVYNISVIDVEASYDKHLLTYVDDEYIATEMSFEVSYQVNILTDDEDTMYKDDDTKEWKYFDTIEIPIKDERSIKADVIFYLKADDEIDNFDIEEINKGKSLIIRNKTFKDNY